MHCVVDELSPHPVVLYLYFEVVTVCDDINAVFVGVDSGSPVWVAVVEDVNHQVLSPQAVVVTFL